MSSASIEGLVGVDDGRGRQCLLARLVVGSSNSSAVPTTLPVSLLKPMPISCWSNNAIRRICSIGLTTSPSGIWSPHEPVQRCSNLVHEQSNSSAGPDDVPNLRNHGTSGPTSSAGRRLRLSAVDESARPTAVASSPLLEAIVNLSRFHREHEKFYAPAPREQAVAAPAPRPHAARAGRPWSAAAPRPLDALSPYEGADGPQRGRGTAARRRAVHGRRGRARRDHPPEARPPDGRGRRRRDRRVARRRDGGLLGRRRRARSRLDGARRPARRTAPHHRQRLAGRHR